MKHKKILTSIVFIGTVLLACYSCTREELQFDAREDLRQIPVSLSLKVAGMETGTPETKAIMDPDLEEFDASKQIYDFWVLQFDGTDAGARLYGNPSHYIYDEVFGDDPTQQVQLLPSTAEHPGPFTIAVVANLFSETIYTPATLGALLDRNLSTLDKYEDILHRHSGDDYFRMSGAVRLAEINDETQVSITLKRNVSKITLNIKCSTDQVTLKNVQLQEINTKYYQLTHVGDGISAQFTDPYSASDPYRMDKDMEAYLPNSEGVATFTYYVPANLRGTNGSEHQYTKGLGAPEGATRFCLYGTYVDVNGVETPINYTYYLGENLVNDFNLKPNYHYTYNITINAKGDADHDYRVEDLKEVKLNTDANSYMVHPPKGEGQYRIYAIPVRRAAVFWNRPGVNGGVYGASLWDKYSSYGMGPGTEWTASILWSDFKINDVDDFLIVNSGKGYDPKPVDGSEQQPYFKIKVRAGMEGNVVIAVKIGTTVLWSWHIWITDYDPDKGELTPTSRTYVYGVEGGHVHRYNTRIFKEKVGGYQYSFVMDRNLGASGTYFGPNQPDAVKGQMLYQFGRKDPFMQMNQNGVYNVFFLGGTTEATAIEENGVRFIVDKIHTGETDGNNTRYAVNNPMNFIAGNSSNQYWTENDDISEKSNNWIDKLFARHNGDQEILEKDKSIYDPCPAGWKVPVVNLMNDDNLVLFGFDSEPKYPDPYKSPVLSDGYGYIYYPEGNPPQGDPERGKYKESSIFFPITGYRTYTSSNINFVYSASSEVGNGKIWTASYANEQWAYSISFAKQSGGTKFRREAMTYTYGLPVRCVRE